MGELSHKAEYKNYTACVSNVKRFFGATLPEDSAFDWEDTRHKVQTLSFCSFSGSSILFLYFFNLVTIDKTGAG